MLIGSAGTVFFNLLFGLGAYLGFLGTGEYLILYYTVIWAANSYFQSYSALSIIKVNAGWFHVRERGRFSAIFGVIVQSGRALVYVIGPLMVVVLPWQWMFFLPAVLVSGMVLMTYLFVQNAPEDCGHPALDVQDASSGDTEPATLRYVLRKVFTNPVTLTIAVAELCTGFVRHGFEQWFPRYMIEAHGLALSSPVFQKGAVAVVAAGIAGAVFAGTISDRAFRGRRPPVAFMGYALQIISLGLVWLAPSQTYVIVAFIMNSFAISVVHSMLTGVASMDFGGRKAAATAAGAFDGMQYLGGSFVGIGMGLLLDRFGWSVWSPTMIGSAMIGAFLMLALWNASPKVQARPEPMQDPQAQLPELVRKAQTMPRPLVTVEPKAKTKGRRTVIARSA